MCGARFGGLAVWLLAVLTLVGVPSVLWGQTNSGTGTSSNNNNNNNNGNNGNLTGEAGVTIDAQGVLRTKVYSDPTGQVMRDRIAAAKQTLNRKVATRSQSRKVSLNRLEQAILAHQGTLSDEMRCLAGLQRVRHVFYYPDSKDIVIEGQAEGWVSSLSGRIVGLTSGRPVVQLQDLVAALRMFPAGGKPQALIGCSIDPTQDGLAAMQQFVRGVRLSGPPSDDQIRQIAEGVRTSLGYQTVTINGAGSKTHFAQVMVEADYRMKLIGIGLEQPPVKLVSYVDRANNRDMHRNALARWYFMPDYQCVRVSKDGFAMELVGDGVKLVGEDEVVTAAGERRAAAGRGNRASKAFVMAFTKKYPELAERSPVYAELRNLIDLAIAAAYIQQEGYCEKAGWKMEFFGSEHEYPIETYDIPKTVESAVNALWRGNTIITPVGGGVHIQAAQALDYDNMRTDEKGKIDKLRESIKPDLATGQWWWD